jgi:hypothetical protein
MLTKIAARNFKAFGESPGLDLSLSGLNLLLGENNSGKTSAVDVVAAFVQTARDHSGPGLRWVGELIDLGPSGEYAIHNGAPKGVLQVSVEIPAPANFLESARQELGTAENSSYTARTIGYRILVEPDPNRHEYEFLVDGQAQARHLTRQLPMGGNRMELEIPDFQIVGVEFVAPAATGGSIFNPSLFVASTLSSSNPAHRLPLARLWIARRGIEIIREVLSRKVFLVGAGRGIQKGDLDQKFAIPDVGRSGQHTLQVLSAVFARSEYRKAAAKIREWSQVFGLSEVSSGWAGGRELHSGYIDSPSAAPLPLRSAGFGSQQILPIIVQLFASPEDSLVVIEEPEISLHPAAQVQLVRMFAEAVRTGRQVVITTHSQYLVMALQELVNGEIQAGDIAVYHFSRAQSDSVAERLPIDKDGVLRGWIPSFAKVEQRLLSSWMSRVHGKLTNE